MKENYNIEQIPFGADSFAENPEPRCPCLLLLDTSGSMAGEPIRELNAGLAQFKQDLMSDSLAIKRVEIAVINFGPVQVQSEFHTAANFIPPIFSAQNNTPMGQAIVKGIEILNARKQIYKTHGIPFYRPWVFLITDGEPTDSWDQAAKLIAEGEKNKSFAFFAVGVENANMNILSQISVRKPVKLRGLMFRELFLWLSNSMKNVSHSSPDEKIYLPPNDGWAAV